MELWEFVMESTLGGKEYSYKLFFFSKLEVLEFANSETYYWITHRKETDKVSMSIREIPEFRLDK